MATFRTDQSTLDVISKSIEKYVCFLETGSPKIRRNEAIDNKDFASVKKTTHETDRLIVNLIDLKEKMARVSPGRAFDLPDELLPHVRKAIHVRLGFIETGTSLRRHEVERAMLSGLTSGLVRPMLELTNHQRELSNVLLSIDAQLANLRVEQAATPITRPPLGSYVLTGQESAWAEPAPRANTRSAVLG